MKLLLVNDEWEHVATITRLPGTNQWEVISPQPDIDISDDERCIVDSIVEAVRTCELMD